MKTLLKIIVFIGLLLSPYSAALAESITAYNTTVRINSDATLSVHEDITYDFETAERHGIYRTIPIAYDNTTNTRYIKIDHIAAELDGAPASFTTSRTGKSIEIKIGDANRYVTGEKKYTISYTVDGAINNFADHDELYWNAIGTDWNVPITNARVIVSLPASVTSSQIQISCYTGTYGETHACTKTHVNDYLGTAQSASFIQNNLEAHQAFTTVVGFPKGLVPTTTPIGAIEAVTTFSAGSAWWYLLVPVTFIAMIYYWWKYGRDPKGTGVIIAEYEAPDNLSPAEVGLIYDNHLDNRDVSAEIIQLAIKGYLTITRLDGSGFFGKTDYELHKSAGGKQPLTDAEQALLTALFTNQGTTGTVRLSELTNTFASDFARIRRIIKSDLVAKGYLDKHRYRRAISTGLISIGICIVGILIAIAVDSVHLCFSFILSGIVVLLFAFAMPARNKLSVLTREKILGLKRYITVAEKARIDFHNAPEKNPALFEKLLPFAMVMGVETAWAKQFDGIYTTPPNWYHDNSFGNGFNALLFTNSLHSFYTASTSTLVSTASSGGSGLGGGGFSGGGFGGGGGGSW